MVANWLQRGDKKGLRGMALNNTDVASKGQLFYVSKEQPADIRRRREVDYQPLTTEKEPH
jgi:hypothetical protein